MAHVSLVQRGGHDQGFRAVQDVPVEMQVGCCCVHEPVRSAAVVHDDHRYALHVNRYELGELQDQRRDPLPPKVDHIQIGLAVGGRVSTLCAERSLVVDVLVDSDVMNRDRQQLAYFGVEEAAANAYFVDLLERK